MEMSFGFVRRQTSSDTAVMEDRNLGSLEELALFIAAFWVKNRFGPTFREIQKHMGIGSLSTISNYVQSLSDEGWVTSHRNAARTLVPTDKLLGLSQDITRYAENLSEL